MGGQRPPRLPFTHMIIWRITVACDNECSQLVVGLKGMCALHSIVNFTNSKLYLGFSIISVKKTVPFLCFADRFDVVYVP